jgi:hypothetical protein
LGRPLSRHHQKYRVWPVTLSRDRVNRPDSSHSNRIHFAGQGQLQSKRDVMLTSPHDKVIAGSIGGGIMSSGSEISAVEIASSNGLDPKAFRNRLRSAGFSWHSHGDGWTVLRNSAEHRDMVSIATAMTGGREAPGVGNTVLPPASRARSSPIDADTIFDFQTVSLAEIAPLIEQARRVAVQFYRLTGKPLGITGEVGEYEAARLLNLSLLTARSKDFDAICPAGRRVQIKARMVRPDVSIGGQRVGRIKKTAVFDAVVLVLLDLDYQPWSIWQVPHSNVMEALNKPGSRSRNERGALGIGAFTRLGKEVWRRE